ncbi:MAG: hypothetical protein RSF88_09615 [Lachnospiraceae bacterium]
MKKDAKIIAKEKFNIRNILNNGVIAAVLALLVFLCNIPLPELIREPLSFIGGITMPLSMMVIGSAIGGYSMITIPILALLLGLG